jgi:hypothetical protein
VLVHKGEDGMTVYVNPDTSRRNGEVVELWVLANYMTIQTEPLPPYLSETSQREIDCTQERIRLLAVTTFSGNMGSGELLYRYSDSKDKGIPVEPGSVAQALWKFACNKK